MKRTIDLDEQSEYLLHRWAEAIGASSDEEAFNKLALFVLRSGPPFANVLVNEGLGSGGHIPWLTERILASENLQPVRSTSNVMGGDHCIRNTRIPVWLLVSYKGQGFSDSDLLANYPGLNAADLIAAWDFYASKHETVERERKRHEEAE